MRQSSLLAILVIVFTAVLAAEAMPMFRGMEDIFDNGSAVLSACERAIKETASNYLKISSVERVLNLLTNGFLNTLQTAVGTIILSREVSSTDRVVLLLVDSNRTMYGLLDNTDVWTSSAYYIILLGGRAPQHGDIRHIQHQLWQVNRVYLAFFIFTAHPNKLFFYDSIKKHKVQGAARELIPVNELARFRNMELAPLRIAYFIRKPTMIRWRGLMSGSDGSAMCTIAKKMNFTPHFVPVADGMRYGYKLNNTFFGSLRYIVEREADIAGNGHFVKQYDTDKVELSHFVGCDKLSVIVPKADQVRGFSVLMLFFGWDVWLTLFAVNALLGGCYAVSSRLSVVLLRKLPTGVTRLVLLTFQLALSVPTRCCHKLLSQRILLVSAMVLSLVMVSTFQASMFTFLRNPIHEQEISSLRQLVKADLHILTTTPQLGEMLRGDDLLDELNKKIRIVNLTTVKTVAKVTRYARVARVSSVETGMFMDGLPADDGWPLHRVQQSLSSFYIAYLLPRGSPFNPRINQIISRLTEGGFFIKWAANVYIYKELFGNRIPREYYETYASSDNKPYSLGDLSFAFQLLISGLLLSTAVFISEIVIYKQLNTGK